MPIPFLLGALAVGAGVIGAAGVIDGIDKTSKAKSTVNNAESRHKRNQKRLKDKSDQTFMIMDNLAKKELETFKSFQRFSELFEKIKNKPEFEDCSRNGTYIPRYNSQKIKEVSIGAEALLSGLVGAALGTAGGYAAAGVTTSAVFAFGTAGTGAAISGLKGAALTNATLAYLGGGTIAAGGGGMALGGALLTGATLGVGLLVGGIIFSFAGDSTYEKANKVWEEMLKAEKEMEKIYEYMEKLGNLATKFSETFIKVENCYRKNLSSMVYIIEDRMKINWSEFTEQEKLVVKNTVLLVGLLYKLGQIRLVSQNQNKKELNEINTWSVTSEIDRVESILKTIA